MSVSAAAAAFGMRFTVVTPAAALGCLIMMAATAAAFSCLVMMAATAAALGPLGCCRLEAAVNERLDGIVGRSGDAGKKANAGLSQCGDGATADAAADHGVNTVAHEQIHHVAVSVPGRGNDFGSSDAFAVDRVDLHCRRLAEVREDLVFIEGKSDFHDGVSKISRA